MLNKWLEEREPIPLSEEELAKLKERKLELENERAMINTRREELKKAAIEQAKPYQRMRKGETRDKLHEAVKNAQYNWLSDFVYILMGEGCERGYVEINSRGEILIKQPQVELLEALKKARLTIGLSSTLDVKEMAMSLKINEDDIIQIRRPLSSKDNVTLPIYPIAPNSNRWDNQGNNQQLKRMKLAVERLKPHEDVPIYAPKKYVKNTGANRWYGNHDIGFNLDSGQTHIIFAGDLFPDEGVLKRRYLLLNGSLDGFENYYEYKRQNAWIQRIGRARSNRYPNQRFTLSIIAPSKSADFSFLCELGYQPLLHTAAALGEDLIPTRERKKYRIFTAIEKRLRQGLKVTQVAIAKACDCTQAWISIMASRYGGWKRLVNAIRLLIEDLKAKGDLTKNALDGFQPEEQLYYQQYAQQRASFLENAVKDIQVLEQEKITQIVSIILSIYSRKDNLWGVVISLLSKEVKDKLLTVFFHLLPSIKPYTVYDTA